MKKLCINHINGNTRKNETQNLEIIFTKVSEDEKDNIQHKRVVNDDNIINEREYKESIRSN